MSQHETIGIIGAGLMGHGIAQVFALAGHPVRIHDPVPQSLETVRERIAANLNSLDLDAGVAARVEPCSTLADAVAGAGVIFEAAPEKLELKQDIFEQLEAHAGEQALLASNTSVIQIGRIGERMRSKERLVGTHWWNPPYLVPLVEVVSAQGTSQASVDAMIALLRSVGKTPVHVRKDVPGFVGNRLQHALWREAIALVQEGVCDAATVDIVVKSSFGMRLPVLGPLENADLVGTDLTLDIHENVLPHIDRTPGPLPYLKELVASGKLGMKSGEGFMQWSTEQQESLRARLVTHLKRVTSNQQN